MKRLIALLCVFCLCASLCACSGDSEDSRKDGPSLSQVVEDRKDKQEDKSEEKQESNEAPPTELPAPTAAPEAPVPDASPFTGDTFPLTISEYTDRLNAVAAEVCPGLTAELLADEWSAVTNLNYNGTTICQLAYFSTDDYLDNPYPDNAMNADHLSAREIRYVNVLDFLNLPHPDNFFWAVTLTFDPMITEAEARDLARFLADSRAEHWGNYLVAEINGIGYGHALPVNQMEYSGSIVIRAGADTPELCVHDVDYEFGSDGYPKGQCKKCGQYVFPVNYAEHLTDMTVVKDTNGASGKDIQAGDWKIPNGTIRRNSLKFWVTDREGMNNSEEIQYALDKEYTTLAGTIEAGEDSNAKAEMWIEIYLDGRLIYTSERVGYTSHATYLVDISGGSNVRIRCITDSSAIGYCVVSGIVF